MADFSLQAESVCANPDARFWGLHADNAAAERAWLTDEVGDPEHDKALDDAWYRAERAMFACPAGSAAAILAKCRVLLLSETAQDMLDRGAIAAILRDLERLARQGGAA